MSRIGKLPVALPAGVKVSQGDGTVTAEGPKGKNSFKVHPAMAIDIDAAKKEVRVRRPSDSKEHKALHGLTRALIANLVKGVLDGYEKKLEINGVGYNAKLDGQTLTLNLGYADPVKKPIPAGLKVEVPKPTEIWVRGVDKQQVGEFAATVRKARPPEPYNGKGVKYGRSKDRMEETIKKKAGKAFGSGEK